MLPADWNDDAATLLYDEPSSRPPRQQASTQLSGRRATAYLSPLQVQATVVAAFIGATAAAWSIQNEGLRASASARPLPAVVAEVKAVPALAPQAVRVADVRVAAAAAPTAVPAAAPASTPAEPARRAKRKSAVAERERPVRARPARPDAADSARAEAAAPRPPKSAPPVAAVTARKPGLLRINSRPWSALYVDGRRVGNTPQMAVQLAPGEHQIKLVSKEFDLKRTLTIRVRSGETVTRIVEMMQ